MRGDADRPLGLAHMQVVGVERQVARQPSHLQVGHRGVQVNRPGHVLHVHIAANLPALRDLPLDVGEREVVAVVERNVALHLVR